VTSSESPVEPDVEKGEETLEPGTPFEFGLQHLTGDRQGHEEHFSVERISIGRGKNNHCSFDSEKERSVSHRHSEIRIEDSVAIIYDIGSLNGTYVNGRRVRRSPLVHGDEIGLGREGPRMRFLIGPGSSQGAATGGLPGKLAATAQEPQPLDLASMSGSRSLLDRKVVLTLAATVLALLLSGGFLFVDGLLGRIKNLEKEDPVTGNAGIGTKSGSGSPSPVTSMAPAVAAAGQRGAVIRLYGAILDESQRLVDHQVVGWGGVVTPSGVVTTHDVLSRMRRWFAREPLDPRYEKRLLAAPGGVFEFAVPIESVVRHPRATESEDANVVLLLLEEGRRLPRATTAPPSANDLRFFPPHESAQSLVARQLTDALKETAPANRARLIRFDAPAGFVPPPAGMPIFSGSDIVGLSLGRDVSGWAISSLPISELLRHAESATPELITSE